MTTSGGEKPCVIIFVDTPDWAFDASARRLAEHLSDEFDVRIVYKLFRPNLRELRFDILYILYWGEDYHHTYAIDPKRIVKQVSSHRWEGRLTPAQLVEKHLSDAATLSVTSKRLHDAISPVREVFLAQNGFEPTDFFPNGLRTGPLRIGWAGNKRDPCKGLKDVLRPAIGKDQELFTAGGHLSRREMVRFYNSIDVLCVASTAEGEPLTLLEGMACGCFPVCVDVGIVPELVRDGDNGLIIERTPAAFRSAFDWCEQNVDYVRASGVRNAEEMLHTRTWDALSAQWRDVIRNAYRKLAG